MPFFSIFSSARMIRSDGEHVPFSASMAWMPILLTLLILIPGRNIYLGFVLLIFIGYLIAPILGKLYHLAKTPFRYARKFVGRMTGIAMMPLEVEVRPIDISRKRNLANDIAQVAMLALGAALIVLGLWTIQMAIGVDIVTGLEVILVFSASFIVGFHTLAVALSLSFDTEIRLTHLNKRLRELSQLTLALLLIFGIWTYLLIWPIDIASQRMLLVYASVFTSIWAGSLLVSQSLRTRILSDFLILVGLSLGIYIWLILANMTLVLLGIIALSSVMTHLSMVCLHYFDRGVLETPVTNE
jgi:hypothetical protein